jgi:MFS family permease
VCLCGVVTSLWSLCLCYGGLFGMGVGLSYTPPLVCGYKHFPQHKGLVSGFVVSGFGAGAFVFNQVKGELVVIWYGGVWCEKGAWADLAGCLTWHVCCVL